jgi:hypothetical protein
MDNDNKAYLIIPDIHHKVGMVERIRANHPGMPAIFLGDYFDDFYDTPAHMEVTCRWLKQAIGRGQDTFLLGNLFRLSLLRVGCSLGLLFRLGCRKAADLSPAFSG